MTKPDDKRAPLGQSQVDKFRDAARELGTDDDPDRFKETVRKLAKAGPLKRPAAFPEGYCHVCAGSGELAHDVGREPPLCAACGGTGKIPVENEAAD